MCPPPAASESTPFLKWGPEIAPGKAYRAATQVAQAHKMQKPKTRMHPSRTTTIPQKHQEPSDTKVAIPRPPSFSTGSRRRSEV